MRYRIRVRPLPMGRTVFTLQPGQQWQSQGQDTSKASGQFVFHLKAKSVATFEVVGGKASCTVWVQGRIRQGCRMKIKQGARLVVRYQQAPQRVLLYSAGQRETVLWGNPKQASWKSFVLKKPKIVRLALYGGKGIVCVIRNKAGSVLSARSHAKGCVIEQPLQPGEYQVGASSRAYPIPKKRMRLSFTTALPVREGEKNSYLLGSGESRWFKFTLTGKRYVGLAAIGSHDDLQCELRSQANRRVLVGCQRHSHLRKGTYWYRVSLPEKAQATAVRIVLRGQTPPAQTAPASYLKNLLQPKR